MDVCKSPVGQPKLKFKDISFDFKHVPDNRWIRLAEIVQWEELELLSGYRNHFGSASNPALPFRVAFGALLVQARLRLTDEETVEQIRENPYIQYFLGFEGYRSEKRPFDPSMMVYIGLRDLFTKPYVKVKSAFFDYTKCMRRILASVCVHSSKGGFR